jgi:hypothetical protein
LIESSAAFEVQSTTEGIVPSNNSSARCYSCPATGLTILILLQFVCGIAALQMVVGMIPVEPEFPQSLVLLLRESGWIATWELIRA